MHACRDDDRGFQLYHSDPSGNYGGWKATAIGQNHQAAQNILKQDYKDDISLEEAMQLVIKVPCTSQLLSHGCSIWLSVAAWCAGAQQDDGQHHAHARQGGAGHHQLAARLRPGACSLLAVPGGRCCCCCGQP